MDTEALINEGGDERVVVTTTRHPKLTCYKTCKTAVLFLVFVSMGLWATAITPCVDILKDQVHSDYEQLARAMAARSAGVIFGSIIGGYLADKFQRRIDLLFGVEVLMAGLAIAAIPWTSSLTLITTAFAVNGLSHGGLSAGGNAHAMTLWGASATGPVHFIHFGFGVGTILGPTIMTMFLPNTYNHNNDTNAYAKLPRSSSVYHNSLYHLTYPDIRNDTPALGGNSTTVDIRVPFAISGGFTVIVAFLMFVFICFPHYKFLPNDSSTERSGTSKKTFKEIISPGECAAGNVSYGLQMFFLIFVFFVALIGKDTGVTIFIEPLATSSPHLDFSLRQADILVISYAICYAAGRLIISVVGIWVPIQIIIFVEALINVVALVLLIIYGLYSNLGFWLTNMLFSTFTGPMFPSGMAWIDRYIKMTGLAFSILDVGIGLGSFAFTWTCGYLLKTHPHVCLYYLSLGCCIVEVFVLIVMQVRGSIAGDRHNKTAIANSEQKEEQNYSDIEDSSPLVQ